MASERITSYTMTTSSNYDTDVGRNVRSIITPRNLVFQRTLAGSGGGRQSGASQALVSGGGGAGFGAAFTEVSSIKSERDREKKDMQDLNSRFASYIEKVRFLEAQNRRLVGELDKLKAKWGKESSIIKSMYQTEVDEAKRLFEEAEREKSRLEVKLASLEEQLDEIRRKLEEAKIALAESREKLERQNQQLSDYEAEMNLLRRREELLECDRQIYKKTLARLQDALNRARIDLDNETLLHVDAANRRSMLEEELEYLKQFHEQELRDLAALACRDTTNENRELWKSEMSTALKVLQQQYDDKLDDLRNEMDTFYSLKVQEFRTTGGKAGIDVTHTREEINRVRTQIADMRSKINDIESRNANIQREIDELTRQMNEREGELESENNNLQIEVAKLCAEKESIVKEFEDLKDAKLGLELEISAYRKLLEGEDNTEGLRQVVESYVQSTNRAISGGGGGGTGSAYGYEGGWSSGGGGGGGGGAGGSGGSGGDSSMSVSSQVRGSMSGRTTYQRSAKGPVAIAEATSEFIILENTGRKEEDLSDWSVKRTVDGSDNTQIKIPSGTVVRQGNKLKVWARGLRPSNAPSNEIEVSEASFGQGKEVVTKLHNPSGDDRASITQRTVYAS